MAIQHRAAQIDSPPPEMTDIAQPNRNLLPDIPNSSSGGDDHAFPTPIPSQLAAASTDLGIVTFETAPLPSTTSFISPTTQASTPTTTASLNTASPSPTPAASHGLPPSKLAAAIVVPIAFLAILIPIIVFWFLNHRRKLQEQRHTSHRSSHSREPMIEKLREPIIGRQPSYKGPAPARPMRAPAGRGSPHQSIQEPLPAHTRNSLGLFNFGLSPTTPKTPQPSRTPESETSPQVKVSVARALEMRRSQPSIVQPHAHTSETRVTSNPSTTEAVPQALRAGNRGSANSTFDPPPPYASPRPSESAAARSHFAPLSRIGTRHLADRSPPQAAAQLHHAQPNEESDRSTYASSDAIEDSGVHGGVRTPSSAPSLDWPSPPQPQGVVARKPIPSQAARVTSHSTSPHDDSHLSGPFEAYLPDNMSDVSGFSIDTTRWEGGNRENLSRQGSTVSSIHSLLSPNDSDTSTIQPHHLV